MAEARPRASLRVIVGAASGAPTIDAAREALGGPSAVTELTAALIGTRVIARDARGVELEGVVVHASDHDRDVWIGSGRFVRVQPDACRVIAGGGGPFADIVIAARRFARLVPGERVTFADNLARSRDGTLVEKCRYGALVEVPDGRALAVAFAKLGAATR